MRLSFLSMAVICLLCTPALAQVPEGEYVIPELKIEPPPAFEPAEIEIPEITMLKAAQDAFAKRKSTLTKKHLKAIDKAEKDYLKLVEEFHERYSPYPKDKAHKVIHNTPPNTNPKERENVYKPYREKCDDIDKGDNMSCHDGNYSVMRLWEGQPETNKANAYSFPEISPDDIVTITGKWVTEKGHTVAITPKEKPKVRDQFNADFRALDKTFEALEATIDDALMHAISQQFQKKKLFGKHMPTTEELNQRLRDLRTKWHDPLQKKHAALWSIYNGQSGNPEGFAFEPHPDDLFQYVKNTKGALPVSIHHQVDDLQIEYEEAWFNGYATVARGLIKKAYLKDDNFQPETEAMLTGKDFWLTCEGFRISTNAMGDFKQNTHRIFCQLWTPRVFEAIVTEYGYTGQKRYTKPEIVPIDFKVAGFFIHKTDQNLKDMTITLSSLGAHDDDLP